MFQTFYEVVNKNRDLPSYGEPRMLSQWNH